MEQRFDFATDDTKTGFRLNIFEVYNWGTYDGYFKLDLAKSNGLLTGDIGSGKSTIVDALTTLLVPHQKIVYNKAAGAESKERSLNSYILGEYKSSKDDNFTSAKAISIRDASNTFSVLLANFKNDGYEEEVTIAQFFYISSSQVHKFFVVSKSSLSIKKDFFDFKDIRELKKTIRKIPHLSVYDSFKDYSKDFRRLMGIKNEQALNLFYQTVSLKSIGNLTQFIRSHMLEPSTMVAMIDELCKNFSELNHMHTLVLRAKRQIELLYPIDKEGKKYESSAKTKNSFELYRENLSAYFALFKITLLKVKLQELDIEKSKKISQKEQAKDMQNELNDSLLELNLELKQNGGDRLRSIQKDIKYHEQSMQERKKSNKIYNEIANSLQLRTVSNEHIFLNNLAEAQKKFTTIESRYESLQDKVINTKGASKRYEDIASELEVELVYLKNNPSNIPRKISQIRQNIANELGLNIEKLPFVGELIEVKDREWEGAIERILHSFSLALLVDSDYYDEVSEYVDRTNLKGKLVYLKVQKNAQSGFVEIGTSSLLNKINIKAKAGLYEPLKAMLDSRFNIPCVDNIIDFRRFKKALTIKGQFKTSLARHEKDDRFSINDSRNWVLGWNNATKLQKLQEDYEKELEKIEFMNQKISSLQKQMLEMQDSRDKLRDILKYKEFEQIDWYRYSKKIEGLLSEKEELQKSSDIIKVLQDKIEKTAIKLKTDGEKLDTLIEDIGKLQSSMEQKELELGEAILRVQNTDNINLVKEDLEKLRLEIVVKKLNLNNIKNSELKLREYIQKQIDSLSGIMTRSAQNIIKQMGLYKNEFAVESKEFDSAIESLDEFRQRLVDLKKDDLPKWEKRFKELFREKTIQNIVIVQTELEHQADEIKSKIDKINNSLRDIEYSDGTYIELMAERSKNVEIREFKESLRHSISGSINEENLIDESKFLEIKTIIERLNGRENHSDIDKKWRLLVTDVRNWFDFSAMERFSSDESEKEFYPHSGGKSGGQKEKLAYTVLASSLAFQFGLEHDEVRSRSFRFVMIDEAFGRGSDESSRYALRLFEKLNLQLLVITPKQKINIIEPFVNSVHFVHNQDGRNSSLLSMSIEEFVKNRKNSS
ncbi:ATP-binding protein [Sulfurimonas sp.]|uniref:ATP-binding protein n=1 Tax=Sulfurimonas sp. TaxID=2022749 RepID=UPI002B468FBB|nr:SbcC/MukB-like Walker B domain-containing protein [Sulfurimonas sp.]